MVNRHFISSVKKHEYSEGIVLRVYNTKDKPGKVNIRFGFSLRRCCFCDLLENTGEEIPVNDNSVSIYLEPKKIQTIVVY